MKMKRAAARVARAAAILAIMVSTTALAQNAGNPFHTKEAANKFSQSNVTCGTFALYMSRCVKESSKAFEQGGKEFFARAYLSGIGAGLSEQALSKRVDAATDQMSADINDSCDNADALFDKYSEFCKALFQAGPSSSALAPPK